MRLWSLRIMTLHRYLQKNYGDLRQAAHRIAGRDGDDLLHEVILQLYQTKDDTINGLLDRGPDEVLGVESDGKQLQLQDLSVSLQVAQGHRAPPQVQQTNRRLVGRGRGSSAPRSAPEPYRRAPRPICHGFEAEVFAIYFEEGHTLDSFAGGHRHLQTYTIHHHKTCQKRTPRGWATR